ncbi:MAG: MBL fold metallo-hydrolase [Povalibacter sp.]
MVPPLLFRQLFDQSSGTYTYLLGDTQTREAVLIDCVYEQHGRDLSLIRELNLQLIACIETHCHADHVTGAWLMRHALGSQIAAAASSGMDTLDRTLRDTDTIAFGRRSVSVLETPGHTNGCISLVLDDQSMVFTGDCLLIRGCGRTDFQDGSARKLFHSIKEKLFSLPDDCIVYPAHDYAGRTASSIGEERQLNPRIGGEANETDFVGYLENMRLPHPKQLDVAVPANLRCGRPHDDQIPRPPSWAPVTTTYGGVLEISPQWVAAHADAVHILDVRTRHETNEERTRIRNAQLIPIDELRTRLEEVPKDKPVMTICRSGKRSVLAFTILRDAGWTEVANTNGGLLRWQAEGLPTEHSS